MGKKKTEGYLSPKKVLDKQEYLQYKQQRIIEKREKLQKIIDDRAKELKQGDRSFGFNKSVGGRLGNFFRKGVRVGRLGITRSLYNREQPTYNYHSASYTRQNGSSKLTPTGGIKTGKRGRPSGSYDQRYAQWGGVYGYRKAMAQKRRLERIRLQQQGQITPRQRDTLQRLEYQRAVSQQQRRANDPFFGTDGNVQLDSIQQQINDACNLVD